MRIALGIEYDGTDFHGWQQQKSGLRTVQSVVESALAKIADEPINVTCAGRTDAGVHAYDQVIHFDTTAARPNHSWILGTNTYLPKDVAVKWAKLVTEKFHARFAALSRSYRYVIANQQTHAAIMRNYQTWYHKPLDEKKMAEAAQYLLGEHDFSSFRSAECQAKTAIRNVTNINITRQQHKIIIEITANAFLHHMVRNIVGVLLRVGDGRQTTTWVKEVLQACDRCAAGITAPPQGLYLIQVKYPTGYDFMHHSLSN